MKWVKRIFLAIVGLIFAVLLLFFGMLAVDSFSDAERMAKLTNTEIENPNGPAVRAYVAPSDATEPQPAVIMIHEFWGLRESVIGKADALSNEGYVVIAPDTYRGVSTELLPRAIYQVLRTPDERVNSDLDAVFAWAAEQPNIDPERIAIIGFCYGGRVSISYSMTNNKLAATSTFYGGGAETEASKLAALPGPVLGVFGEVDASIPLEQVEAFKQGLEEAGIEHQVTVYDGMDHAFVSDVETIRAGGAPGEAWDELLAFLKTNLQ